MLVGIQDDANTLYGDPDKTFPILKQLRVQLLRVNMYWGGKYGAALWRPDHPQDPADPAYDWSLYDRTVQYASQYGIKILFSIYGTPGWANGRRGLNHAPMNSLDLLKFAYAAAKRYSGTYIGDDGRKLPAVKLWLAWNEPNNPIFLSPQYGRVGNGWVPQSAVDYARICNAVYDGIHLTSLRGESVACGATAPRGNNSPVGRSSISPIAFLLACKRYGLRRVDAWAHHPYYGMPTESPATPPRTSTAVTLGNIDTLIAQVTRLYGPKPLWITEYGYQTNPPDHTFGVSYLRQAEWLVRAYAIARANPRIAMMIWFLLRDEPSIGSGWQSGFFTIT